MNLIQHKKISRQRQAIAGLCVLLSVFVSSCQDFVKIDPPQTDLIRTTVFTSDATAKAAIADLYYEMFNNGFASGGTSSVTFLAALSSDELVNYVSTSTSTGQQIQQFADNTLLQNNANILTLWTTPYQYIYEANAILEGLASSSGVSADLKVQMNGEAKFIRAFCHFYLTNLFGDVPLVLTTDYRANSVASRTPKAGVYQQIIADLLEAQKLLSADYSFSNNEKIRVNKGAASALLARVYLYTGDWAGAALQATNIIDNTDLYSLDADLNTVFLKNSSEAIWQLSSDIQVTNEVETFLVTEVFPTNAALTQNLVNAFESQDQRRIDWMDSVTDGVNNYYFPTKYKGTDYSNITEYSMVLRLAEQYLIRAEARAQLSNISGAQDDLNAIRNRANLGNTTAIDKPSLLLAIEQERRIELFTEWGHRWLDLKRTGRADAVLAPLKSNWTHNAALYPIPESQLLADPAMTHAQNPGY